MPPPGSLPSKGDLGLSWIELAISFVLATGLSLPIHLPGIGRTEACPIDPDKIQLLPPRAVLAVLAVTSGNTP